jgi:hypothetical protein
MLISVLRLHNNYTVDNLLVGRSRGGQLSKLLRNRRQQGAEQLTVDSRQLVHSQFYIEGVVDRLGRTVAQLPGQPRTAILLQRVGHQLRQFQYNPLARRLQSGPQTILNTKLSV